MPQPPPLIPQLAFPLYDAGSDEEEPAAKVDRIRSVSPLLHFGH